MKGRYRCRIKSSRYLWSPNKNSRNWNRILSKI